jgi:hypothetical protein
VISLAGVGLLTCARKTTAEHIANKARVDSTDERNMMGVVFTPESRNGTNGTARVIEAAEGRAVGTMESRTVAQ